MHSGQALPRPQEAFSDLLRSLRSDRGRSLDDIANEIHFHRGYVGNVENGKKFPARRFAELADERFVQMEVCFGRGKTPRRNGATGSRRASFSPSPSVTHYA